MSKQNEHQYYLPWIAIKTLKIVIFSVVFSLTVTAVPSPALSSGIVILYPEVRKPYSKIYEDIIEGITEQNQNDTNSMAIDPNQPFEYYRGSLTKLAPDTIIALGQKNISLARELKPDVPIVAGGIIKSTENVAGISMIPDTGAIIDKLILLYGEVRNLHIVTNAKKRKHRLEIVGNYANDKGINLIVHDVETVQAAANEYKALLADIKQHDAIWLMKGKAISDSALLSKILETAWKKRVAVFSSNPTHVKRGALFAIYPNNKKLGASLAILATKTNTGSTPSTTLAPLTDFYTVLNSRTSRHLGISIAGNIRAEIDSVF